jgi:hypothetical protein
MRGVGAPCGYSGVRQFHFFGTMELKVILELFGSRALACLCEIDSFKLPVKHTYKGNWVPSRDYKLCFLKFKS